jgi:hypothetical protein
MLHLFGLFTVSWVKDMSLQTANQQQCGALILETSFQVMQRLESGW